MSKILSLLKIELQKLRYRRLWLPLLAAEAFQGLWMYYSASRMDSNALSGGYNYLFIFSAMLETILYPLLLAMLASRMCDIEHKGDTFKLLYTMEKPPQLFQTKTLAGFLYILLLCVIQTGLILGIGHLAGITQPFPAVPLAFTFATALILSAAVFLFQLILSLLIENQLIPLVIGLLGSFLGIFTLYIPQIRSLFLWGYYVILAPATIDWDPAARITSYPAVPMEYGKLSLIALAGIALYAGGRRLFSKKGV